MVMHFKTEMETEYHELKMPLLLNDEKIQPPTRKNYVYKVFGIVMRKYIYPALIITVALRINKLVIKI